MFEKQLPELSEIGQDEGRETEIETSISEDAIHISISELDLAEPVHVEKSASLLQAINKMVEFGVGALLVLADEKLIGIVTERDFLLKVASTNVKLDDVFIEELMTPNPKTLSPDDLVIDAMILMDEGGYRRVPVVDGEGKPLGILSYKGVIDRLVEFFPEEIFNLPPNPIRKMASREGA